MFQEYVLEVDRNQGTERVKQLRLLFDENNIDGYLVGLSDAHHGEGISEDAQRLRWLTGFSGSAGSAIILKDQAILFTDGRYEIQIREQTDGAVFSYEDSTKLTPYEWLAQNGGDKVIGYDPWLYTLDNIKKLQTLPNGCRLLAIEQNLIDHIWLEREGAISKPIVAHSSRYTSQTSEEKIAKIRQILTENAADALILTERTSIAWTFNMRGGDIAHTPVASAFAIIPQQSAPIVCLNMEALTDGAKQQLESFVQFANLAEFLPIIGQLSKQQTRFMLDPKLTAQIIATTILANNGQILEHDDPVTALKAQKDSLEIAGARAGHLRDGVAMSRFLYWLDQQKADSVNEIDVAQKLENIRAATGEQMGFALKDISFDTISGSGPNGAIIHYRVTNETNRRLDDNTFYLVDSGAQYCDSTTDITRTIVRGVINGEQKQLYTLVLKGLIALTNAVFPTRCCGRDLDSLARQFLWQYGFDYAHGTGHGVGSYLAVHEGPQAITPLSTTPLKAGMIISNEPGYYRANAFGIRLENLILVKPAQTQGDKDMLCFETLTLCPFDRRAIDINLLERSEIKWLNAYHQTVYQKLAPHLSEDERSWLRQATTPILA